MTDETGYNHPTTLSTGSLEDADLEIPDSITEAEIADEAVTEPKIADDAVTENKIVALAITAGKIAAGAITTAKLAADAVIAYVLNVGGTVQIDEDGIYVTDGAIVVENSGATVIIDGESDMFRIVASGTYNHTGPNSPTGGRTTASTTINTGLNILPAFHMHLDQGLSGSYTLPFLNYINGSSTLDKYLVGAATNPSTDNTSVGTTWFAYANYSATTFIVRYFIFEQTAF